MSDYEKGFMRQLLGLLLSPRETFEGINESELLKSIAIVLVIAVLSAWASMLYFVKTDINLLGLSTDIGQSTMFHPGAQGTGGFDLETIKRRIAPFVSIASGIGVVTRWLVPSIFLVFGAKLLIGSGSSKRLLVMTGFASTPQLIQQLIRVVDAYAVTTAGISSLYGLNSINGLIGVFLNQGLYVINLFGILTMALTCIAVSVNYNSSIKNSVLVTLLSYVVYIFLRLYLPFI